MTRAIHRGHSARMNSTPLPPALRADCNACCGLCCVALPFDAFQGFGFDKPAHTPCSHLRSDDRCSIHDGLRARGFAGCSAYDCYGAGQWVTQNLAGATWRTSPETAAQMFEAFRRARALHELMAMLRLAITHAGDEMRVEALEDALEQVEALRDALADDTAIARTRREVLSLLRSRPCDFA
jgi:hypothetical protein